MKLVSKKVLTNGSCVITIKSEVTGFADALPRLVAMSVLAVPVRNALSAVRSSPPFLTPAGIGHHALTLIKVLLDLRIEQF